MAVPREMHERCHQTLDWLLFRSLFAKCKGRDVMMYPMNSCEMCEKQRKGQTRMPFYLYYTWKTHTELRDATP